MVFALAIVGACDDEPAATTSTFVASSTSGSGGSGASGAQSSSAATGGGTAGAMQLGIEGDRFTIDGVPTFLLGVSYFDGRNFHIEDLDELAARRFNLIRIWLDWNPASFFDAAGGLVAADTLLELAEACRVRGIVVDVTILDTDLTFTDRDAALRAVVSTLAAQPNVFFDIANEHDHAGNTLSHADVTALALAARRENPAAILTVSSQGGHIVDDLTLSPGNIDEEIVGAGLDLLTPHFSRTADFYDKTDQRVTLAKEYLNSIGHAVPVYLQEEARRGHSGLDPTTEQFLQAAREARDAGAAGWVLHNDAGLDLSVATFFAQLDEVERATVDALANEVF